VRERAANRLWRLPAALPTLEQRAALEALLVVPNGSRQSDACDADDDGMSDAQEISRGRNPLVNEPAVITGTLTTILLDD
ncbi:MAG: hypothetical protein ACR2RL_07010, partial [Gammaproteobacteria bacterium]